MEWVTMAIHHMDVEHWALVGACLLGFIGAISGKEFRAGSFGGFPISRTEWVPGVRDLKARKGSFVGHN
jgi:hypothetical protein